MGWKDAFKQPRCRDPAGPRVQQGTPPPPLPAAQVPLKPALSLGVGNKREKGFVVLKLSCCPNKQSWWGGEGGCLLLSVACKVTKSDTTERAGASHSESATGGRLEATPGVELRAFTATLWPFPSALLCEFLVPEKRMALFVSFGFIFSMSAACFCSYSWLRLRTKIPGCRDTLYPTDQAAASLTEVGKNHVKANSVTKHHPNKLSLSIQ